jgi:hypothetical protein
MVGMPVAVATVLPLYMIPWPIFGKMKLACDNSKIVKGKLMATTTKTRGVPRMLPLQVCLLYRMTRKKNISEIIAEKVYRSSSLA